ncbi:MAG: (2Fe-2S)-binding protein [Candidatus Baldrarchaeia archaeon]
MDEEITVKFILNGKEVEVKVKPNTTLLDLLRRKLKITSVKRGCERGECGACTVLIDNQPVNSCLVLAPQVDGKNVVTIEGIVKNGELHPIQEAFIETGAVQCGFCTPGIILTLKALFDINPDPSEEDIRKAIEGNLCRCTGYTKIIEAAILAKNRIKKD